MTRIYLTEILDEVLGIPKGIIETSEDLYNRILEYLEQIPEQTPLGRGITTTRIINPNGFLIDDYSFEGESLCMDRT